jgi:hypothetical protein
MVYKKIRLSMHASEQCKERGSNEDEISLAIRESTWEVAKNGRFQAKYTLQYNANWNGKWYALKEVRPIFVEEETEIVVVTVITYYY